MGHECGAACSAPVRCIICSRIKVPVGQLLPRDLHGMRCTATCPGYTIDPPAGHLWPVAMTEVRTPAGIVGTGGEPVAAARLAADVQDALGRALCQHYFPAAAPA